MVHKYHKNWNLGLFCSLVYPKYWNSAWYVIGIFLKVEKNE